MLDRLDRSLKNQGCSSCGDAPRRKHEAYCRKHIGSMISTARTKWCVLVAYALAVVPAYAWHCLPSCGHDHRRSAEVAASEHERKGCSHPHDHGHSRPHEHHDDDAVSRKCERTGHGWGESAVTYAAHDGCVICQVAGQIYVPADDAAETGRLQPSAESAWSDDSHHLTPCVVSYDARGPPRA